jgi:serine/threonine protein kinase
VSSEPDTKTTDGEEVLSSASESSTVVDLQTELGNSEAHPERSAGADDLDRLFDLPLEKPEIAGVSVLSTENRNPGSGGVVFPAWRSGHGRVRVLVSRWSLPTNMRVQAARWFEALKECTHSCLTPIILSSVEADAAWYIVPDPGGIALSKVLSRHGIPRINWVVAVMSHVASGLAELHKKGVLHLDIRPEVIQVDPITGIPKFASYGFYQPRGPLLRSVIRAESNLLTAASILAPELVDSSKPGQVDQGTDIYAFGATLYTLLAGTTPFTGGTTATILRKVVREDPTPVGRIRSDIPESLEALCVACLKKNPKDRPANMDYVVQALTKFAGSDAPGPISGTRVTQVIGEYRVVRIRERRGATVRYEVISKQSQSPLILELGPVQSDDTESSLQRQRELMQTIEDHPNVLKIHEIGIHEGRRYTVTDDVDVRTLEDLLAEGPLPVRRAAEIARDIASALAFCHAYGVVHRGARPDLILVNDKTGRALLTSVGRAPEVAEEGGGPTALVSRGLLFSTLFYFAPEQVNFSIGTIDGQTDTYVLAVTLYEMLTGRRPFTGDGPRAVLAAVMAGEPRSPGTLNHQVDADMSAICLKALIVEKYKRYLTAREFESDLTLWLDGQPVRARSRNAFFALLRRLSRRCRIALKRVFKRLGRRLLGSNRH